MREASSKKFKYKQDAIMITVLLVYTIFNNILLSIHCDLSKECLERSIRNGKSELLYTLFILSTIALIIFFVGLYINTKKMRDDM